jgi:uncharacterized protein
MENKIKIIFIHGNGGATIEDIWFPYLKKELTKLGFEVIANTFPDNILAQEKYWIPFLQQFQPDKNTIIIGHSSGAIAAMRFAENNKILGSILVGAYHTDLNDENEKMSGYFDRPWDFEAIKNNQNWIVQFNSTDDPWVPIEEARYVHQKLNTDYHEYNNQGHFGGDYEKKEFSEILEVIKKKLAI